MIPPLKTVADVRLEIERQLPLRSEITSIGWPHVLLNGVEALPIIKDLESRLALAEKKIAWQEQMLGRAKKLFEEGGAERFFEYRLSDAKQWLSDLEKGPPK